LLHKRSTVQAVPHRNDGHAKGYSVHYADPAIKLLGAPCGVSLAGILLTALYAGVGAPEPPSQEEEGSQEEGPQDEAREELAGEAS
jgi:hypothetical protein